MHQKDYVLPDELLSHISNKIYSIRKLTSDDDFHATAEKFIKENGFVYIDDFKDINENVENLKTELEHLIECFKEYREFSKYSLTSDEIKVIAIIWDKSENKDHTPDISDVIFDIFPAPMILTQNLSVIIKMLDKNIVYLPDVLTYDYHSQCIKLAKERILLDHELTMLITGTDCRKIIDGILNEDADCNISFTLKISKAIDYIITMNEKNYNYPNLHFGFYFYKVIEKFFSLVLNYIEQADSKYCLKQFFTENNFDDLEKTILLILLSQRILSTSNMPLRKMLTLIACSTLDALDKIRYFSSESKLLKLSFIESDDDDFLLEQELWVNSKITSTLLNIDHKQKASLTSFRQYKHLKPVEIKQNFNNLILPHDTLEIIKTSIRRYKRTDSANLSQWGLLPNSLEPFSNEKSVSNCVNGIGLRFLLYGASGTGKTFAAGAIASELNKPLLLIDAAQLRNKWYGETEKNIKTLFLEMNAIINKEENAPIFLLNEADQLIHNRNSERNGCDYTENAIQNIFLEELETFSGIFVATTNLIENLDSAFFRRFNFKIEFKKPEFDCRKKLWKCHLPSTIPGAENIDLDFLAKRYSFTGGQIRIIVENACTAAINREISFRSLTIDDIIRYCDIEEISIHKITDEFRSVGF